MRPAHYASVLSDYASTSPCCLPLLSLWEPLWRALETEKSLSKPRNSSTRVKDFYSKYLLPFEKHLRKGVPSKLVPKNTIKNILPQKQAGASTAAKVSGRQVSQLHP